MRSHILLEYSGVFFSFSHSYFIFEFFSLRTMLVLSVGEGIIYFLCFCSLFYFLLFSCFVFSFFGNHLFSLLLFFVLFSFVFLFCFQFFLKNKINMHCFESFR